MILRFKKPNGRRRWVVAIFSAVIVGVGWWQYQRLFGAPVRGADAEQFVIAVGESGKTVERLKAGGFIRNERAFVYALKREGGFIKPGGYGISQAMSAWEIARILTRMPSALWVTIPEGLRKEETAVILAATLGWSSEEKEKWITSDTDPDADHAEGVYFPDTYLIPRDEQPPATAERMRARFEEKFVPFAEEALRQNIRWVTVVKIASLLEREAAGYHDMPLIAGIIWNRLVKGMRLEIDATLQYARGDKGDGWWAPITPADKAIDSPYNTYKNKGLPPHPIANPGIAAINATLHPEDSECLFYLHDRLNRIHCAETYQGHKDNIERYLR